jgi:hypothetical protein
VEPDHGAVWQAHHVVEEGVVADWAQQQRQVGPQQPTPGQANPLKLVDGRFGLEVQPGSLPCTSTSSRHVTVGDNTPRGQANALLMPQLGLTPLGVVV